jgi:hypothetical protein
MTLGAMQASRMHPYTAHSRVPRNALLDQCWTILRHPLLSTLHLLAGFTCLVSGSPGLDYLHQCTKKVATWTTLNPFPAADTYQVAVLRKESSHLHLPAGLLHLYAAYICVNGQPPSARDRITSSILTGVAWFLRHRVRAQHRAALKSRRRRKFLQRGCGLVVPCACRGMLAGLAIR